jgi:hypothetical protein
MTIDQKKDILTGIYEALKADKRFPHFIWSAVETMASHMHHDCKPKLFDEHCNLYTNHEDRVVRSEGFPHYPFVDTEEISQ